MTIALRDEALKLLEGRGAILDAAREISKAMRDAGVEVPGDMSVVSFDEDQCLAFLQVPVSSVCMPLPELGAAAVEALIARIEGNPAGDVMIREPITLRERASVAPPP